MYPPRQDQARQPGNSARFFFSGLVVVVTLSGAFGITGCSQLENPAPGPTGSAPPPAKTTTQGSSSKAPGPDAVPSIIPQFINAVNASNKSEASNFLCPKITGEGSSKLDEAVTGSAQLEIAYSDPTYPPKIDSTQTDVEITGTVTGNNVKGSVVSLIPSEGNPCIMYFNFYQTG